MVFGETFIINLILRRSLRLIVCPLECVPATSNSGAIVLCSANQFKACLHALWSASLTQALEEENNKKYDKS
jgi:hypothetical protein